MTHWGPRAVGPGTPSFAGSVHSGGTTSPASGRMRRRSQQPGLVCNPLPKQPQNSQKWLSLAQVIPYHLEIFHCYFNLNSLPTTPPLTPNYQRHLRKLDVEGEDLGLTFDFYHSCCVSHWAKSPWLTTPFLHFYSEITPQRLVSQQVGSGRQGQSQAFSVPWPHSLYLLCSWQWVTLTPEVSVHRAHAGHGLRHPHLPASNSFLCRLLIFLKGPWLSWPYGLGCPYRLPETLSNTPRQPHRARRSHRAVKTADLPACVLPLARRVL